MFKLSMKCLNFVFKNRCTSYSHSLDCRSNLFQNIKCISVINFSKYSAQSSDESKSSEFIRIYDGPLGRRIKSVKMFSFMTSTGGLILLPKVLSRLEEFPEKVGYYLTLYSMVSIFTFGTPVLMHWLTRKYVLYIDYDPAKDNYTLYTYSLFLRLTPLTFNAEDVARVSDPLATVSVRGATFLMHPENFYDLTHYKRMVGYDKEMDLKLEDRKESLSAGPELKRPEIPNLEEAVCAQPEPKRPQTPPSVRQIPKTVESEKADDDIALPINLRKKKKG